MKYKVWLVRCITLITLSAAALKLSSGVSKKIVLATEHITPQLINRRGSACKNCKVALITNQTGKTHSGESTVAVLQQKGFNVAVILAPEHGYWGTIPAEKVVTDMQDPQTGIMIKSLYGHGTGKQIDKSIIENIDLIIVDLQDVGMRHYTYISTLFRALQAAATYNKPIVVLDRPNPLGGRMEGPLVAPELESFISIVPIPLRHGMTIGEIAAYMNKFVVQKRARLSIVPLKYYERQPDQYYFLAPLSPNVNSLQTIYGYSFLGIMGEITPFDVGVGSDHPFQLLALPQAMVDSAFWDQIEQLLASYCIESKRITYMNKRKKKPYEGLRLTFNNPDTIATMPLIIAILEKARAAKVPLKYSQFFDKVMGVAMVRTALEGNRSLNAALFVPDLQKFYKRASTIFLYKPWPYIPYR